jgi:TPR repeat protein
VEWFSKAAEQGNAEAQAQLGDAYNTGYGVPQDYTKAVEWFRKAAEQGNTDAQTNMGGMYDKGQGVQQDYAKAVEWYRKAAEKGNAFAQNNLGFMYDNGHGVPQDYAQAVEWYRKAAEQGNAAAQNNLSSVESKLQKMQLHNEDEARGYKRMSFTDFQLDAKTMRTGKRLSINGFYEVNGQMQSLTEEPSQMQMLNAYKLLLLSEDAPRDTRKKLIELQNKACGHHLICQITVLGHVQPCSETLLGKKVRDTMCLAVDDIRVGRD